MTKNRFVHLKNEAGNNIGFKKSRNVQKNEDLQEPDEISIITLPNVLQQNRLRNSLRTFSRERLDRIQNRTLVIPANVELVKLYFNKMFNDSLKKDFYQQYGLLSSSYEDFNKTILFEISDSARFLLFISHLEFFYESSLQESYEKKSYSLIALIQDFKFLSSKDRVEQEFAETSSLSLIPIQNREGLLIKKALIEYFEQKNLQYDQTVLTSEFLMVSGVTKETLDEIIDNFDIVKAVSSARTERRRPGIFGDTRRDYGFTVSVADNLPLVGIIDSGVTRIDPLRDCMPHIQYDLTNNGANWDECGHGTTVAAIVALGSTFLKEVSNTYKAKARIAVIKVLHNDNDYINIAKLTETILQANHDHGIKLFNLSLNDPLHKKYNESISDYAFLLDKLAYENDLLIFISVGNISEQRLKELILEEPHASHEYPVVYYAPGNGSDIHTCESTNISKPSESMNNISVGALAGNLEDELNSDITPSEELPAYYTRKFHYDYDQLINGSSFIKSQRNKHLNKPDLVFEGGDLFEFSSGMEILRSPIGIDQNRYFSRSCGTSLATPMVTSMAAEIMFEYPSFKTQTVKALLINSAYYPLGKNPGIFQNFTKTKLLRKLSGFGRPNEQVLLKTDDNSVTFIIESEIAIEDFQTISINIPSYISSSANKLNFKGTLCYSFLPVKDNHLAYLPFQITFGIFQAFDSHEMSKMNSKDYVIKTGMSWSDDFFGVDNRLFSNVQQIENNVTGEIIGRLGHTLSLAINAHQKKTSHKSISKI